MENSKRWGEWLRWAIAIVCSAGGAKMITWITGALPLSGGSGVDWASWANALGYGLIMTALFVWNRLSFFRLLKVERTRMEAEVERLDAAIRTTRADVYPRLKALEDKR